MRGLAVLVGVVALAGCTVQAPGNGGAPAAELPQVAQGTAVENCKREMWRRTGSTIRITKVSIFEAQRGVIEGRGNFGTQITCFTNPRGEAVNVMVDRRRRRF